MEPLIDGYSRLRGAKLASLLCVVAIILAWYATASESQPWTVDPRTAGSRFETLRMILKSSNQGYHLQTKPGVPMEVEWEDPGQAFFCVVGGFAKRALGLGPLDPLKDAYRLELVMVLLVFGLVFWGRLFRLPRWFYWAAPVFTLLVVLPVNPSHSLPVEGITYVIPAYGILPLSVAPHWAKIPAAFWTAALVIQLGLWFRECKKEGKALISTSRAIRVLIYGMVYGLLVVIRKDVFFSCGAALGLTCLFLLVSFWFAGKKAGQPGGLLVTVQLLAVLVVLGLGVQMPKWSVEAGWAIRDANYEIKQVPRIYGHPVWHNLYIALGYVPNELGIKWDDKTGCEHMRRVPGNENIPCGSELHEQASKKLYLDTIRKHPDLLWRNIKAKAWALVQQRSLYMAVVLASLVIIWLVSRSEPWLVMLMLLSWLGFAFVPIWIYPARLYYLEFMATGIWISCVALVLVGLKFLARWPGNKLAASVA